MLEKYLKYGGSIDVSCLELCRKVAVERKGLDKKWKIVQMLGNDEPIPHWYYRSGGPSGVIVQPWDFTSLGGGPPYVGLVKGADPKYYGEGRYIIDPRQTEIAKDYIGGKPYAHVDAGSI